MRKSNVRPWCLAVLLLLMGVVVYAGPSSTGHRAIHFPAGSTGHLAVRDGFAYVLNAWTRGDGVLVFDVNDPDDPRFVRGLSARGYLRSPGGFCADMLYIPAANFSVMAVDVSEPDEARLIRNLFLNFPAGDVQCLTVDGDRLFVGGRTGGLRIFDISRPDAPVIAAHYPKLGHIVAMAASEDRLVLRPQRGEAVVATVTDEGVKEKARLNLGRSGLQMVGQALYENGRNELVIHDLSDASDPRVTARIPGVSPIGMLSAERMLMRGPDAVLTLFDVSHPSDPQSLRTIALPEDVSFRSTTVDDGLLYGIDRDRFSLRIFDISGQKARPLSERFIMRNAGNLALGGGEHAFLSYTQGVDTTVFTLDREGEGVADFAARHAGTVASSDDAFKLHDTHRAAAIARVGQYLLKGDGVLDISNPLSPKTLHPIERVAADIAVRGDLAAVVQGDRLTLLDVSELPQYEEVGTYKPGNEDDHFVGVALGDGLACIVNLAGNDSRVEIVDISNPAEPQRIGRCEVPAAIVATLYEEENLLYVPGVSGGGMTLLDVSDPADPRIIKTCDGLVAVSCYRIRTDEDRLYFTDSMRGIKIADISDPRNPVLMRTLRGSTEYGATYTDFEIHNGKIFGLRFSLLDIWEIGE